MKKSFRNIYLFFAISFIVTVIISMLYLERFSSLQKSSGLLLHTSEIKNRILKVQANLVEAENSQRGYLITHDKELLKPLTATQASAFEEIEKLKGLTADNLQQQELIPRLKELVSLRYRVLYENIDASNGPDINLFLMNVEKGKKIMQQFIWLSNRMDANETALYKKRERENKSLNFVTSFYIRLTLIISFLFLIISFFIITRSFKKRYEYQQVLEQKIKELNVTNAEMEQMAFVASHDLQEPLRKIRTYSDKLLKHEKGFSEEGEKSLQKVAFASQRMQDLLNDFLHYTRILKTPKRSDAVDLNKLLEDAKAEINWLIDKKNATIESEQLPTILADQYQVQLLFTNLLDNALKFAKPDVAPLIKITVSKDERIETEREKKYLKISVADNGIGFEKEFAEKIFIIFQRLHPNTSSYTGKGLGLAICKRVMINHDGYIKASGEPGVGCTFDLFFPQ